MPQKGKADPLAAPGAWGGAPNAGAKGAGQAAGAGGEDYEVVEIVEDKAVGKVNQLDGLAPVLASQNKTPGGGFGGKGAGVQPQMSLDERERNVRRREAALAAQGLANLNPLMVKNFPSCCPIVHHDIANDIPDYNKSITRAGFVLFMLTCVALIWNFIAVLLAVLLIDFYGDVAAMWFLAVVYMVIGIPGGWFTWYGRLYRAMMSDGALSWAAFFFFILVHTAFAMYSSVAPSFDKEGLHYGHAGWLPTIDLFKLHSIVQDSSYQFVAICYAVGASLWTAVSVLSIIFMVRVYRKMRGGSDFTQQSRQ